MERLYRTVVQIEVAKETIQRGDLAHLRVALILLDNAVEVMMHRVIKDELFHAEWYERMLRTFPTGPLDPKGEELRTDMASHVISRRRREEIRRYFGAKVDFLSDRDRIPRPSARALKHLHNYRNETQHEDLVREESIRAVVMLLFDMTTNFLLRLKTGSTSWRGGADYSWVQKYGIESPRLFFGSEEMGQHIARQLRADLPLDDTELRNSLIVHLTERLDAMEGQLAYVRENMELKDSAEALRNVQFWKSSPGYVDPAKLSSFVARHDLASIAKWRAGVEALNSIADKLDRFDQFATIEDDFEPLERMIDDVVGAIDEQIQLAIDIARGK